MISLGSIDQVSNLLEEKWGIATAQHQICAILFFILILYSALRAYQKSVRRRQFFAFARAHNCAPPPTVSGSFLSGLRHKWKRLNQRGDIFNDYMNSVFLANGPTHAIVSPLTGDNKAIYTIQPENVKTILSTKFSDYHRPSTMPNALNPVMGQGVFTSNGEAWAHSRSLVRAQFSNKRVRDVSKLDKHMENAFEALDEEGEDGWTKQQEILLIFNRFTLDSATEFMFGTGAGSHEVWSKEKKRLTDGGKRKKGFWKEYGMILGDFATAFDIALDYVALRLKLGRLWFLADGIKFRLACFKVKSYADSYIRDAVAHAETAKAAAAKSGGAGVDLEAFDDRRYGLISELVDSYPDKVALRNQVMQLLVAGRDTTAATLTWALILLEAHPHIFERLRAEVEQIFGTESQPLAPVIFENLRSCTYLQHVVSEVVRLYPTGPLNARKASVDTILPVGGGSDGKAAVAIKKGTTVAYNTYLMHRWEDAWGQDAWEFKPERWEGRRAGWEYVPFHGGPQTCLGQQHALTEMAYVLTRLLQRYDGISSSTRKTNFENGIRTILVPKNTVMLQFHRRAL